MENAVKFMGILIMLASVLLVLVFAVGDFNSFEDFWKFMKETWDLKGMIEDWKGI